MSGVYIGVFVRPQNTSLNGKYSFIIQGRTHTGPFALRIKCFKNMEEEKKAVEEGAGEAAAQQVTEENPLEKELAVKDALIAKLTTERENYRKGMLKAKGKISEEEEDDSEESLEDKVQRMVKEQLIDAQLNQAQREKDDLLKSALARNKELETALKNRSQIATAGQGSGSETKVTPKDNILSEEKLKQLKGLGWDDKKIELYKKNLMKVK